MSLPKPIKDLRKMIADMPSFSDRGAERFLEWWWNKSADEKKIFTQSWEFFSSLHPCKKCFYFSKNEICEICSDSEKDNKKICVITSPFALGIIEKETNYDGLFFILGGEVVGSRKSKQIETAKNRVEYLGKRIEKEKIEEIIIATDFTSAGEATAKYIEEKLKKFPIKISRLAQGFHKGDAISYSDPMTLRYSFERRNVWRD